MPHIPEGTGNGDASDVQNPDPPILKGADGGNGSPRNTNQKDKDGEDS